MTVKGLHFSNEVYILLFSVVVHTMNEWIKVFQAHNMHEVGCYISKYQHKVKSTRLLQERKNSFAYFGVECLHCCRKICKEYTHYDHGHEWRKSMSWLGGYPSFL